MARALAAADLGHVGQSLQCLFANFGQSILQVGKISAGANIVKKQPRNFVDTCSV